MFYLNRVIKSILFLYFLLFFSKNRGIAATVPLNEFTANTQVLPLKADFILAKDSTYSIRDISSGKHDFELFNKKNGVISPGQTLWAKVVFINKSKSTPVLHTNGDINTTLFYQNNAGEWVEKTYSVYQGLSSKEYFSQEHVFMLPYADTVQTIYLKMQGIVKSGTWTQLIAPELLAKQMVIKHIFHAVFGTLLMAMMAVSMLLYFRLKDRVYLYYSLFILFISIFSASKWGFLYSIFGHWHIHYHYLTIPYGLANVFLLAYTRKFLDTKKQSQSIDLVMQAAIAIRIAFLIVTTLFTDKSPLFTYSPKMDLLLLTPALIAAFAALYQKYRPARYFTVSISIIYIAFLINSFGIPVAGYIIPEKYDLLFFRSRDFIQSNMVINFSFIEIFLFTFALADRFFILKHEAAIATQKIIATQQDLLQKAVENQELKDQLNVELEKRVQVRTAELYDANAKLIEQAEEIKRMNELLREDNERLVHNLELLNKARLLTQKLSYSEFQAIFPNDNTCLNFIADLKWNNGYQCKSCGYRRFYLVDDHLSRKCRSCKHKESPMAYTLLENLKFDIPKALYITYLAFNEDNPNVSQIAEEIQLRKATCYQFYNKALQAKLDMPAKLRKSANWTTLITR